MAPLSPQWTTEWKLSYSSCRLHKRVQGEGLGKTFRAGFLSFRQAAAICSHSWSTRRMPPEIRSVSSKSSANCVSSCGMVTLVSPMGKLRRIEILVNNAVEISADKRGMIGKILWMPKRLKNQYVPRAVPQRCTGSDVLSTGCSKRKRARMFYRVPTVVSCEMKLRHRRCNRSRGKQGQPDQAFMTAMLRSPQDNHGGSNRKSGPPRRHFLCNSRS